MTKLVIFDLDGTLLDTIGDLAASCDAVMEMHSLPRHTLDEYRHMVGRGILRLVEAAIPEPLRSPEFVEEVRRDFVAYYLEHIDLHTRPYDGIAELLEELSARGIKIAVASNKFQAGHRAPDTLVFSDYGVRGRLWTACGCTAQTRSAGRQRDNGCGRVTPDECIHVGDSGVDMQTAHAAGVRSVGVTWGFRSRDELVGNGAGAIIDRPSQLIELI